MSNASRIYANGSYRTPVRFNEKAGHFELPIIWGGDQNRSYFPDGYDAVYKVKGTEGDHAYIVGDHPITASVYAGSVKLEGKLTSPQYFNEYWLKESSASKWTRTLKFPANEYLYKYDNYDEGEGWKTYYNARCCNFRMPTDENNPSMQEVRDRLDWKPYTQNFYHPGIMYIGTYSVPSPKNNASVNPPNISFMPWGFVPAYKDCGMGFPTDVPEKNEITIRFDTLFGIPVADTKFHFVTFYQSGPKDDFYDYHGVPSASFGTKHVRYLYQGSNITTATIKNLQTTSSGIRHIGVKGTENLYHFWSSITAKKGTHGIFTPIGIGYSGNVNKSNGLTFYDNAVSFRVRP